MVYYFCHNLSLHVCPGDFFFVISILKNKNLVVPKHMNGFLLTRDLLSIPILSIILLSLQ